MLQRFFDCLFFLWRALRLLRILGLRFVVVFSLDDAAVSYTHLDVYKRQIQQRGQRELVVSATLLRKLVEGVEDDTGI